MKHYTQHKKYWILYPVSLLYGIIMFFRNFFFDYGILPTKEFDFPVISVGNLTVGGTGKTPHIEYLIKLLKGQFNLAVLSRGYKRKTRKFVVARDDSTSKEIGDEPRQIKQKFPDITVAVERRRVKGIRKLMEAQKNLHLILMDDAYQHRWVKPGVNILLIDYNRLITKDHLLPYGRLREPAYETRRANIIIVTKCPSRIKPIEKRILSKDLGLYPYQNLYFTSFGYGEMKPVFKGKEEWNTKAELKKEKPQILMVSGIDNPRALKRHLRGISTKIKELHFPDHHFYTQKDLTRITEAFRQMESPNKIIFTTEKDAMRFHALKSVNETLMQNLYYIPVEVNFLDNDGPDFDKHLIDYVKKNRGINSLFKK